MEEHKRIIDTICTEMETQLNSSGSYTFRKAMWFAGDVTTELCLSAYFNRILPLLTDEGFRVHEDINEIRIELQH